MRPTTLIKTLRSQGITLSASKGNLKYSGPSGIMTDELKSKIKLHKAELVKALILERLKIGNKMKSPSGVGFIWEIYPEIGRAGVEFPDRNAVMFFNLHDLSATGSTISTGARSSSWVK